jgi:hypothetical protein
MDARRTRKRLWRWRKNPLRRRDDVVEAWVLVGTWAAVVVGGTLTGVVTAHAADGVFEAQRAERHAVRAVLLTDARRPTAAVEGTGGQVVGKVRWTDADGASHTRRTLVDPGQKAGSRITVWTDSRGELAAEPPSATEAAMEAALLGAAAAGACSGLVVGAGAVARWRLDRRRLDRWGREWDLVGPEWGHKTG